MTPRCRRAGRPPVALVGVLALALCVPPTACGRGAPDPIGAEDPPSSDPVDLPSPSPRTDPIEAVEDCDALAERAERVADDLRVLVELCPGLPLERAQLKAALLTIDDPDRLAALIPSLDAHPELQGLARLAVLDRASLPPPSELPDPATALLTPVDDRILAAVERAYTLLADATSEENQRTRAQAVLTQVHLQALQTLGLSPGRPLPPFARLLAARALHHGRGFCRFYWQRRVAGLERSFAETELAMLELLIDLEATPHANDGALLAAERQQGRQYLQRSGPRTRIAAAARRRPEARGLDGAVLLPLVQELDRLFDHGFVDLALDRAIARGGAAGGPGLDTLVAVVTEDLRSRDLREYERRLADRVEAARRRLPSSRERGSGELDPELPVEWPDAATVAARAHGWLSVARDTAGDPQRTFAHRHARARAVLSLRERSDALLELLAGDKPTDPVVAEHAELLLALLDAHEGDSLAGLRRRVAIDQSRDQTRDASTRRRFALATREALMHPR